MKIKVIAMNENLVLYDESKSEKSKERKRLIYEDYKKSLFKLMSVCAFLLFFLSFSIIFFISVASIFLFLIIVIVVLIMGYYYCKILKKSLIASTLDVKIYSDFMILPKLGQDIPNTVEKVNYKNIERIYWRINNEVFVLILNNRGMNEYNLNKRYKFFYKELIDDTDKFINHMEKFPFFNNEDDVSISEIRKRYGN